VLKPTSKTLPQCTANVAYGSRLCENGSARRSGARLIQTECRWRMKDSAHERFAKAAGSILLLRADNCWQRFYTA
jgi:hypothetical protein